MEKCFLKCGSPHNTTMSRIGKLPVIIAEGVAIALDGKEVKVTGPKGNLTFRIPMGIEVKQAENTLIIERKDDSFSPMQGLTRAMVQNMVEGVSKGFEKKLELTGVGYRAQSSATDLSLSLGFSHQVKMKALPGITFSVAENVITIAGIDKSVVGDTAAKIRSIRPPEPYKGKGIAYVGERIRRKAGKAAKAVGGK